MPTDKWPTCTADCQYDDLAGQTGQYVMLRVKALYDEQVQDVSFGDYRNDEYGCLCLVEVWINTGGPDTNCTADRGRRQDSLNLMHGKYCGL